MLNTINGGLNWLPTRLQTDANLEDILFLNQSKGWVVGTLGRVFSYNRNFWAALPPSAVPTTNDLAAVKFAGGSDRGWIVGSGGSLLSSQDGGISWNHRTIHSENNLQKVTFVDSQSGWIIDDAGRILASTDGGQEWTIQTLPEPGLRVRNLFLIDQDEGFAVGDGGLVLHTRSGGKAQP